MNFKLLFRVPVQQGYTKVSHLHTLFRCFSLTSAVVKVLIPTGENAGNERSAHSEETTEKRKKKRKETTTRKSEEEKTGENDS